MGRFTFLYRDLVPRLVRESKQGCLQDVVVGELFLARLLDIEASFFSGTSCTDSVQNKKNFHLSNLDRLPASAHNDAPLRFSREKPRNEPVNQGVGWTCVAGKADKTEVSHVLR